MFVKTTVRRRDDKTYVYLSLVQSVRTGGKTIHKTLLPLGEAGKLRRSGELDRIIAALRSHARGSPEGAEGAVEGAEGPVEGAVGPKPGDEGGDERPPQAARHPTFLLDNGYCTRPREDDCYSESLCEACDFFSTTPEFRSALEGQRAAAARRRQIGRQRLIDGLLDGLGSAGSPAIDSGSSERPAPRAEPDTADAETPAAPEDGAR